MNKTGFHFSPQSIIVGVSLVVVALLTYFVARPQVAALKASRVDLISKKAQASALQAKISQLTSLAPQLAAHQADLTLLQIAYPKEEQPVEALMQATTMASRAGVTVSALTPGKGKGAGLPVSFTVRGSYGAVTDLLREFGRNLRPVVVRTLNIVAGGEKDAGAISATLGTTFEYNGTPATSATPTPTTGTTSEPVKANSPASF